MLDTNFQIENEKRNRENKAISWIVTVAVHAIIFLFLFFFVITPPDPPFFENEGGMSVNFGTSDVGTGDVQPMNYTPVNAPSNPTDASSQPTTAEENVVTQDNEDAPVMESHKETKPVKKPKPNEDAIFKPTTNNSTTTVKNTKPAVDDNSLFKPGAVGKPNNSKGDGEGGGQGDQGNPNGDPNATSYKGTGIGNGTGNGNGLGNGNVKLVGRKVMNRYVPKNPCDATRGKVMIAIKVNRNGQVVSANFSQGGSTTSDDCLVNVAKQAAMKYTFDPKEDAAEIQTGSILFSFKEN